MEVAKVALASEEEQDQSLEITDIFESHSSRIILIEADPNNPEYLFLIDEEMKLLKIHDDGEGKGVIIASIDMTHHDLEEELDELEKCPWTSITICDRMLTFGEYSFSLQTKFFWKEETDSKDVLVEDRNLPGTLLSV